jgi:hypothetical protein
MAAPRLHTQQEQAQPAPLIGRDEMNLAEFPIALLADYAPKGQKTLYFEDDHGRLTVTGSDAHGLPTAGDADVIVALIYLTKLRNDFKDVKVNFSRYELIKLLNWQDKGSSYKRLDQSLNRWGGVWLVYDKCWWNNRLKCYTSAKMHIIDSVEILDNDASRKNHLPGQIALPFSYFTWNRKFIESCQADNLRQLNLDEYFSLSSAVSKRLYRFLGKRFYAQREHTFDLNEVAFERVGLSRSYENNAGKIKEKLQPAIEELEAIGFLRPLSRDKRYTRIDHGRWDICLIRGSRTQAESLKQPESSDTRSIELAAPTPLPPLVTELVNHGVTVATAAELVKRNPAEGIERQIEILDWLMEKKPAKVAEPGAYLVSAIKTGHAAPKGFTTKAERQAHEEARQAKEREAAAARRQEREQAAHDQNLRRRVNVYLKQLDQGERLALEAKALAAASPNDREVYESHVMSKFRDALMLGMLRAYLDGKPELEQVAVEA